jgi:hypothetical protein
MSVFGSVLIGGAVTTERSIAFLTSSQMYPLSADLRALFANPFVRMFDNTNCFDMSASLFVDRSSLSAGGQNTDLHPIQQKQIEGTCFFNSGEPSSQTAGGDACAPSMGSVSESKQRSHHRL